MLLKTYPTLEDEPFDLFKRRHLQLKKNLNSSGITQPANSDLPKCLVDRSVENCNGHSANLEVQPTKPFKIHNLGHDRSPQNRQPSATKALLTTLNHPVSEQSRELELLSGSSIKTPESKNTKENLEQRESKQRDERLPQQKTKRNWLRNDITKESSRRETQRHKKALKNTQSQARHLPSRARPAQDTHCRLLERLAELPAPEDKRIERNRFLAFDEHNFPTLAAHEPHQEQKNRQIMPISGLLLSSQDYYYLSRLPPIALDREERYNWGHVKTGVKPFGLVSRRKRAALDLSSQAPDPMVDLLERTERIRNKFNESAHVSPKSNHRARLRNIKRIDCSPKCGHSFPQNRRRKRRELAFEWTSLAPSSRTHRKPSARKYIQDCQDTREVRALPTSSLERLDLPSPIDTEPCRLKNKRAIKEKQILKSPEAVECEERSNTLSPLAHAVLANDFTKSPETHFQDAVQGSESPIELHVLPTDCERSAAQACTGAPDVNISNGTLPLLSSWSLGPKKCPVQGSTKDIGDHITSTVDHTGPDSLIPNPTSRKRSVFGTLLDELGDGSWAKRVTFKDTTQVRYLSADRVDRAQNFINPTLEECETLVGGELILSLDTDGLHTSPLREAKDDRISLHNSNEAGRRSSSAGLHAPSSAESNPKASAFYPPEFEYKSLKPATCDNNERNPARLSAPPDKRNSRPPAASGKVTAIGLKLNNILVPSTPSPVKMATMFGNSESQWSSSGMESKIDEKDVGEPCNHNENDSQLLQDDQGKQADYEIHSAVPRDDIISGNWDTSGSTSPSSHSRSHQRSEHYVGMTSNKRRRVGSWLPSLEGASEATPPAAQLDSNESGTFEISQSQSSCSQSHIEPVSSQIRMRSHRGRPHANAITQIVVSCQTNRQRRRKLDQMPSFFSTRSYSTNWVS